MGIVELLLGVVFAICLGGGISMTTSGLTAGEFWVARVCFVVAACALLAAYIYWLCEGNRSASSRIILGIVVGLLAIAGTAESIYWVNKRERMHEEDQQSKAAASVARPPEQEISHLADKDVPLHFTAITSAAVRPAGTILGGISWLSSYGDLRVGIYNGTDFDYERVDLSIVPDVAVTAAAQLTNIPGVWLSFKNNPSIPMEEVNQSSTERVHMPYSVIASTWGYRMRCERLPSHSSIELIMAAVSMNGGKPALGVDKVIRANFSDGASVWSAHRDHTEKIFGPKPVPSLVKVTGRYIAQQKEYEVSESIIVKDFMLEAIRAIPKHSESPAEK